MMFKQEDGMKQRIANWHGSQAADAWREYSRLEATGHTAKAAEAMASFVRHTTIADKLWV